MYLERTRYSLLFFTSNTVIVLSCKNKLLKNNSEHKIKGEKKMKEVFV